MVWPAVVRAAEPFCLAGVKAVEGTYTDLLALLAQKRKLGRAEDLLVRDRLRRS